MPNLLSCWIFGPRHGWWCFQAVSSAGYCNVSTQSSVNDVTEEKTGPGTIWTATDLVKSKISKSETSTTLFQHQNLFIFLFQHTLPILSSLSLENSCSQMFFSKIWTAFPGKAHLNSEVTELSVRLTSLSLLVRNQLFQDKLGIFLI